MRISLVVVLLAYLCICAQAAKSTSMAGLKVVGNQIQNKDGQVIILRGVNVPGAQYECTKDHGRIWDAPTDNAAITVIQGWKLNSIRLPLNEDCWTGDHGANPQLSGQIYRDAMVDYVNRLTKKNIAIVVDLHWNSNTTELAYGQQHMPSKQYSIPFWRDVANTFKGNLGVIFDLFNEPVPNDAKYWDSDTDWNCWKTGLMCGTTFPAAGMQDLVTAVRDTGATNVIALGGIQYATDLSRWMDYLPSDPLNNMVASLHSYDFNSCRARGCWDMWLAPVYSKYPIIATETGQSDCQTQFSLDFFDYCDNHGISYMGWAWLPGDCAAEPALISDSKGTPTEYGKALKSQLAGLAKSKPNSYGWTIQVMHEAWMQAPNHPIKPWTYWFDEWSANNGEGIDYNYNKSDVKPKEGKAVVQFTGAAKRQLFPMCWGCINTTYHKSVTFWVHGGGDDSQNYNFRLQRMSNYRDILYGTAFPASSEGNMTVAGMISGGISASEWRQATFDLSTVPAGSYDGIAIYSDTDQAPIYLDAMYVNCQDPYCKADSAGFRVAATGTFLVAVFAAIAVLLF